MYEYTRKSTGKASAIAGSFFSALGITLSSLILIAFTVCAVICLGPSPTARNLFVNTVTETSALKFIPKMFFTDEEISSILSKNSTVSSDEITDESMIEIPSAASTEKNDEKPLEIINISGSTYNGKLMIVKDPSRIVVSAPDSYGENAAGLKIDQHVKKENGTAGVNAGGFLDENGVGNGGQPLGIVIKNSVIISGGADSLVPIIGFDINNKLIVGTMTGKEALEKGIRDAVTFSPVFIVNGKKSELYGAGSGLNPRTCIGQRKDGAVLMLVIDGRQASSLGATYQDCINILSEYGAVNAANLDGGSSSTMYYNGEIINVCASIYGPRHIPTAFVVKSEQGAEE